MSELVMDTGTRAIEAVVRVRPPIDDVSCEWQAHDHPTLRHVVIEHEAGPIGCTELEEVYLQSVRPVCNPEGERADAQWLALTMKPRSSLLSFNRLRQNLSTSRLAYQARYARQPRTFALPDLTYGNTTVRLSDYDHFIVESREPMDESEERTMALALSLLQGAPVTLLEESTADWVRINLIEPNGHESGHALCRMPMEEHEALKCLLALLVTQTDRAERWKRAGRWFIEGKSLPAPVEFKCMLLLVFLEAFGSARTLDRREVARDLDIDEGSAWFLVELRNALLHSGTPLNVCVDVALHKMCSARRPRPTAFPEVLQKSPRPEYVWLRLCERINAALVRDIGWSGRWGNYGVPNVRVRTPQTSN
ncbi:hypothetical protein [Ottowia sp.]|uniref:hypothetical protein n=1 Tax=Ottowia sp. TaxID=1898956 RepID=UPI003963E8E9|nr:hypothetical protein [Pseudomonadota bacterium]